MMNASLKIQTAIPVNTEATRDDRWEVQCLGSDGEWHTISDSSQMTEEEATTMAREMSIDAENATTNQVVTVWLDQDSDESAWIVDEDAKGFGESKTVKTFPATNNGKSAAIAFAKRHAERLGCEMIDLGDR
jgi:chlorite dismutase